MQVSLLPVLGMLRSVAAAARADALDPGEPTWSTW
jgi:hypothetical protein